MSFSTRNEFIEAQSSEKITLAQIEGRARILPWTLDSGTVYVKSTPYYVVDMHVGTVQLTQATSSSVGSQEWFYDSVTSQVYINIGFDPVISEVIATYRFFYATGPVTASHDLTNSGKHVHYSGRIKSSPGYKHKIGVEQKLTSIVGSGNLKLENNDGELDNIFDTLFFENQEVRIYSWNQDLNFSDARIIFKGKVTNKKYTDTEVTFTIKDNLFDFQQPIPQQAFTDDDNVNDNIKGRYKRWLYGRVDGLQLQSIDQIGSGYSISGTVSAAAASTSLTGSSTSFLSELSPGDKLTIETQELEVESIQSDTSLTLSGETLFAFTARAATVVPSIPTVTKNREYFVAGHATATLTKTIVSVIQLNRIELNDTSGLVAGDFVEFTTGERLEIKNVAPGNIIVLRQNVTLIPTVTTVVTRQPVQQVFIQGVNVPNDSYTISNIGGATKETKITFDNDVEFELAKLVSFGFDATFTNGSRTITTTDNVDLREILNPRDYIRPSDISFTTFYEILSVDEKSIEIRIPFTDPNHTGATQGKRPEYLADDTIVSCNALGRTVNGEPDGSWIQTAAETVRDIVSELNIPASSVNEASFTQGAIDNKELVSLKIPNTPSGSLETTKSVVDKLSKSTVSSVTLDPDLMLKFKVLLPEIDENAITISDEDVINWSVQTTNGDTIRNTLIRYRHTDVDRFTLERGSNAISHSSDFVETYIGTNKSDELDVYLYNVSSARIMAHRNVYLKSLGRTDVKITSDLRFENVQIGDQVILDFDRLYKRLGDSTSRKKVAVVIGKQVTGDRVIMELTDLGNIFNRSSIITPNTAPDFSAATEDEKLKYGYITDAQGLVEVQEDTANTHLIS